MSLGATLSIFGLYNYDNTIFDLMYYPDGFTDDEKQTVRDNILIECAELEVLYPNPDVMKNIISIWSRKELPYWNRVYKAAQLDYNPIENYRRNESEVIKDDRTVQHSGTDKAYQTGSDTLRRTGEDITEVESSGNDTASGNDTTDHKITGYDSNTLVPNTQDKTTYGKKIDTTSEGIQTVKYGSVETENINNVNNMIHGEQINHGGSTDRAVLAYGNIGVTTSQEMLTQEMEVAKIINVMQIIIDSFKNRFCILVY